MTAELPPTDRPAEHHRPASAGRSRGQQLRRWIPALAVLIALAVVAGVLHATLFDNGSSHPGRHGATAASAGRGLVAARRASAIRHLLSARSQAILHGDRKALLATIDPRSRGFRNSQARMLARLGEVPLVSWSYSFDPAGGRRDHRTEQYAAPTWSPRDFALHYRLRAFDTAATDLAQYPTFVDRHGRWLLASLTDFAGHGEVSATDLWDYGPVRVVRRPGVLVLGLPAELPTMQAVAAGLEAAIPRVSAVWGTQWARRVVAEVPATQRELGLIDADHGNLDDIAALSSAEVHSTRGQPAPVGDRIGINPRNWPKLGPLGRRVVLTHELTHVATRADTGTQTPRWLVEGFADYVGFLGTGVTPVVGAAELARAVAAGSLPPRLPRDRAFDGTGAALSRAYQAAWLACAYIAARDGQRTLVRFYRAVGTSRASHAFAVSTAMHRLLHTGVPRFTVRWQRYLTRELA